MNSPRPIKIFYDQRAQLAESPLWHAGEEALYWIDIERHELHRQFIQPPSPASSNSSNLHQSWQLPSAPGCIGVHAQGGLIVALRDGIYHLPRLESQELKFNPQLLNPQLPNPQLLNTQLRLIAHAPYDIETMRFNDGRIDAAGRFWLGAIYEPRTAPQASVYCLARGVLTRQWNQVTTSNGLAFNPDYTVLYHADTPTHAVTRRTFDLKHGLCGTPELFYQFNADKNHPDYGGRPDGAAVDSNGDYWIAMFDGASIVRLSSNGEFLEKISLPARYPTMVAFGGKELTTLYITTADKRNAQINSQATGDELSYPHDGYILSLEMETPGLPIAAYAA